MTLTQVGNPLFLVPQWTFSDLSGSFSLPEGLTSHKFSFLPKAQAWWVFSCTPWTHPCQGHRPFSLLLSSHTLSWLEILSRLLVSAMLGRLPPGSLGMLPSHASPLQFPFLGLLLGSLPGLHSVPTRSYLADGFQRPSDVVLPLAARVSPKCNGIDQSHLPCFQNCLLH